MLGLCLALIPAGGQAGCWCLSWSLRAGAKGSRTARVARVARVAIHFHLHVAQGGKKGQHTQNRPQAAPLRAAQTLSYLHSPANIIPVSQPREGARAGSSELLAFSRLSPVTACVQLFAGTSLTRGVSAPRRVLYPREGGSQSLLARHGEEDRP